MTSLGDTGQPILFVSHPPTQSSVTRQTFGISGYSLYLFLWIKLKVNV